jgi:hypothetical protein
MENPTPGAHSSGYTISTSGLALGPFIGSSDNIPIMQVQTETDTYFAAMINIPPPTQEGTLSITVTPKLAPSPFSPTTFAVTFSIDVRAPLPTLTVTWTNSGGVRRRGWGTLNGWRSPTQCGGSDRRARLEGAGERRGASAIPAG